LLGSYRVAPDIGVFQFEHDFFQLLALLVVVKDTPVAIRLEFSGRQFAAKSDLFPPYTPACEKTRILTDLSR